MYGEIGFLVCLIWSFVVLEKVGGRRRVELE